MSLLDFSIIVAAGVKTIVFLMCLFLYYIYREKFLAYWTVAWGLLVLKCLLDPLILMHGLMSLKFIIFHIIVVLSTFSMAWGTWQFVGRRLPNTWLYIGATLPVSAVVLLLYEQPFSYALIPSLITFGLIHIHAGMVMLRNQDNGGLANKITAYAFILNGIHQFDFPFFRDTEMAPWGYLLDAFLRLAIGIGFVLTYFEKTCMHLERKEKQYRLLTDNAKDVIFRYSLKPEPAMEYISPAATKVTGYTPEEYYANSALLLQIVHDEDRHLLQDWDSRVLAGTPLVFRLLKKGDDQIWVEQAAVPVFDKNNDLVAVEGIIRDISSRRQLEQDIYRLDRLNLVGQMAANLGHEIRNPLTAVHGYLQMLSAKSDLEAYHDKFRFLIDELTRANSLITEYLSLCKNRLTHKSYQNLNEIVMAIFPLIQASATNASLEVDATLEEIPQLLLDDKEIRQLILNLARNGLEAMDSGGRLTIGTYCQEGEVILSIQDQGKGLPVEMLDKIGVPFVTTKEGGTGLGLAICYSIASRHGAHIHYQTGSGGTTFFIRFPFK